MAPTRPITAAFLIERMLNIPKIITNKVASRAVLLLRRIKVKPSPVSKIMLNMKLNFSELILKPRFDLRLSSSKRVNTITNKTAATNPGLLPPIRTVETRSNAYWLRTTEETCPNLSTSAATHGIDNPDWRLVTI